MVNPDSRAGKKSSSNVALPFVQTFALLLLPRVLSASYNLIHDTDETYNYWEPLHFLLHGSGFQTWEYSPEYAIRSWTYIGLHALPLWPLKGVLSELQQFYTLRGVLGLASVFSESFLVTTVWTQFGQDIGWMTLFGLMTSTGMFSASTAFLPSSFTMYTSTMGLAFALRRQYLGATVCFGIGAVLGWPFSVILFMPVVVLSMMESHFPFFSYVRGGIASSQVLLISTVFDYTKYRIWTLVPLNIILYNVLAAQQGRGPEVFGVEPVSYYFKNLLLNFNIMFPLALIAVPVVLVAGIDKLQRIKATACFLVWILVFSLQPHKEERFMYPVYPALVLNCAISLRAILETFGTTNVYISTKLGIQKDALQNTCKICFILTSALLSVLRISLMIDNYSAPLALFPSLPAGQRYCIAGDWYRFPTSFLLPHNSSLSFVESDFKGLLPGKFRDTWTLPSGMNDQNMWSADKVIKLSDCDALVSWKPELSSNHQFYFLDRETGTKHPGYYGYESLKQENSADRLNRLGIDLFGRKLDKEGKRFEEGELAGAIQRDSPKSVLK